MASSDDEKQTAIHFAEMFCNLLDKHRDQLTAYLADDAVLDWFGHTVSSKNSIVGFMKLEIPETLHNLTSIEPSGPIQHQKKMVLEFMDSENNVTSLKGQTSLHDSLSDEDLAMPLDSPDFMVQVTCSEQVDGMAKLNLNSLSLHENCTDKWKSLNCFQSQLLTSKKCGIPVVSEQYYDSRYEGQGDCLFKPSVNYFMKPNRFLEARGSIEFQRTRQPGMETKNMKLMSDTMKWCRFFKLQIAYSTPNAVFHANDLSDGIAGDFKIWLLVYKDNSQCRRNLSEAFDKLK
ncbi:uncharacterized protein LOC110832265 [Zootermopsis nevadensis]|uniref:Nuclear transport factor 2 domain-containing protein n=1 Tax=Zootermopsis nevadensis TaxID=136037 RepID=A0A067R3Y4_ZOONE|nr:uncharacterized protein LOC110832265 [Zootermopsis nevadensis]XP_021924792.1 uncharacterized protein LOC110832265 [Zootermopsis nevadensis]KDR16809.1 hypothetical protein L798_09474 [Zootermopsis nevadensis]